MKRKVISNELLKEVVDKAKKTPRKRINYNFHQSYDFSQRFLNAIEPESYIHPHRHVDPLKDETFVLLKGRGAVVIFKNNGEVEEIIKLDLETGDIGIDIPGGIYHTIFSLESGTVFLEIKPGPYDPNCDKGFASWAPEAESPDSAIYLNKLKKLVK